MFDRVIGKEVKSVERLDRSRVSGGSIECHRLEFTDGSAITFRVIVEGGRVMSVFTPSNPPAGRVPNCS